MASERDDPAELEQFIAEHFGDALELLAHDLSIRAFSLGREQGRQAWQPIETAPKDGTEVLLLGERKIVSGSWSRGGAMLMPHWMGGIFEPTHWMPLPARPGDGETR